MFFIFGRCFFSRKLSHMKHMSYLLLCTLAKSFKIQIKGHYCPLYEQFLDNDPRCWPINYVNACSLLNC